MREFLTARVWIVSKIWSLWQLAKRILAEYAENSFYPTYEYASEEIDFTDSRDWEMRALSKFIVFR